MAEYVIPSGASGGNTAGNVHWKAPVADFASLPASGNSYGDARVTLDTGGVYIWTQGTPDAWTNSTAGEITLPSANLLVGNGSNIAQARAITGDVTISNTGVTTIGSSKVTEAMQVLADNTTNDVSTTKHGYAPKAPNDATQYLDGTGAWSVPAGGGGAIPVPFYAFQPASAMDGVTTDLNTPVSVGGITVEFSTTGSGPYSVTGDVTGGDAREYFRVGDFVETDTDYLVDLTKIVFITGVTETQITGLASAIPYATPDTVVRWRQIMSVTGYDFLDASKRLLSVYNDGKIWFVQGNGSALTGPTTQYGLAPSASIQAFAVELNSGIANLLVGYATDSDGKILYQKVQKVVAAPSAANDPGEAGTIAIDSDYIYVCVATDTWKRAAISTWP